jgi:uncharacterized protein with HEPN domain
VRHIIEAIERIEEYTTGMTQDKFLADKKTFDAVCRNLTVIGEAARQIPEEIGSRFPDVPWAEMRAIRNILTHEYDRVDAGVVWDTLRNDLPPLIPMLEQILINNEN